MIYISRSSVAELEACPRAFYLRYLMKGHGYDSAVPNINFLVGLGLHKGLETLLKTSDIDQAAKSVEDEWTVNLSGTTMTFQYEEGRALSTALLLGWYRVRWEAFQEQYEILAVEKETRTLLAPNVTLMARADAIVRDRETGLCLVFNWKSSSEKKDWTAKWQNDVQAMTEALASEDFIGEKVHGCVFEGFYKGTRNSDQSSSPLIRGYSLGEVYEAEYQRPSKEKPWRRFNAWQEEFSFGKGLAPWIGFLPESLVHDQYLRSQVIAKNDDLARDWIKQKVRRLTDVERMLEPDTTEEDRLDYFEQVWGYRCRGCSFLPVCRKETSIEGLVEVGQLKIRKDHHAEAPQDT